MGLLSSKESLALFSLPSFLAIAVVGYLLHCVVQYAQLRQFKGPPTVGFSKLWLLKAMRSGIMHLTFTETNKTYGNLGAFPRSVFLAQHIERLDILCPLMAVICMLIPTFYVL